MNVRKISRKVGKTHLKAAIRWNRQTEVYIYVYVFLDCLPTKEKNADLARDERQRRNIEIWFNLWLWAQLNCQHDGILQIRWQSGNTLTVYYVRPTTCVCVCISYKRVFSIEMTASKWRFVRDIEWTKRHVCMRMWYPYQKSTHTHTRSSLPGSS